LLDSEELVEVGMRLAADVLAGPEPHHGQLRVLTREDDGPEGRILECRLLDVGDPAEHVGFLLSGSLPVDRCCLPRTRRRSSYSARKHRTSRNAAGVVEYDRPAHG
jgi:hypothetical protein